MVTVLDAVLNTDINANNPKKFTINIEYEYKCEYGKDADLNCLSTRKWSRCECISISWIFRWFFRLLDVWIRISITLLIWIVLGGLTLMIIVAIELIIISFLIWKTKRNDWINYLIVIPLPTNKSDNSGHKQTFYYFVTRLIYNVIFVLVSKLTAKQCLNILNIFLTNENCKHLNHDITKKMFDYLSINIHGSIGQISQITMASVRVKLKNYLANKNVETVPDENTANENKLNSFEDYDRIDRLEEQLKKITIDNSNPTNPNLIISILNELKYCIILSTEYCAKILNIIDTIVKNSKIDEKHRQNILDIYKNYIDKDVIWWNPPQTAMF